MSTVKKKMSSFFSSKCFDVELKFYSPKTVREEENNSNNKEENNNSIVLPPIRKIKRFLKQFIHYNYNIQNICCMIWFNM